MLPRPFEYLRPRTLEAALDALAAGGERATAYAGGTELLLVLKLRLADYDCLVDLKRIPELRAITTGDDTLRIGALATHREISRHPEVCARAPALAALCGEIANPRVRASGTIGGNLCFAEPSADPPTVLAALDATLHLASRRGRRALAADDFIQGPLETRRADDEILLRIDIPAGREATRYVRQLDGQRALVGAAASLPPGRPPRVRLGCLAARPVALRACEAYLGDVRQELDLEALRRVIREDIDRLEVTGDGADYRRHIAGVMTRRAITAAWRAAGREATS